MFELSPSVQDLILLLATDIRHIGLADRHASPGFPASIEVVRNRATARLRHERFQADDFFLDPLWLGLGEDFPRGRCGITMRPPPRVCPAMEP